MQCADSHRYNQPYATQVAGHKHPALMGTGFRGPFKEIWDEVGPIFNECRRTGNSVAVCDQMLPIERHGFREETFFTVLAPFLAPTLSFEFSQKLSVVSRRLFIAIGKNAYSLFL